MKKNIYLCAIAVFILVTLGFANTAYAHTIRIGLLRSFENQNSITISSTSIDIGRGREGGYFDFNRTLNSTSGFTVRVIDGQVVIQAGGQTLFTFLNEATGGRQVRASGGGILRMGNSYYRGVIEFRPSGGRVTAINVICLEEYLYGVLPMEMAPHFHTEALRAQAVAARTFAMYTGHHRRYTQRGFELCDRTCCQAYQGAGRETDVHTQAVRDTSGLMMFTEGNTNPLFTPYFSSSGGSTDNSENVWVATLSHLRGVPDIYEQNARIWTRTYTWAQLTNAVQAEAPSANIGNVTGISVEKSPLGRVQELTFIGTNGRWTATGERTMRVFRHIDSSLLSRHFYIAGGAIGSTATNLSITDGVNTAQVSGFYVIDATGNITYVSNPIVFDGTVTRLPNRASSVSGGTGITINGRGWGHGVGMSQNGANGMAQAGHDFRTILKHYYTGVEIRQWIR